MVKTTPQKMWTKGEKETMRYIVRIQTKDTYRNTFGQGYDISEPVKTIGEAKQYALLVDDDVCKAYIIDMVTGKTIELRKDRRV